MSTPPPDSSAESSAPRPLTAAARSQSWRELAVRRWSAFTVGLLLVIGAVGIRGCATGLEDRRLLSEGVRVDARIDSIAGGMYKQDRSVQREIGFSFLLPGETERRVLEKQKLEPRANAPAISKGDLLPILVDKKNPRNWTDRIEPMSWPAAMAVPLVLTPPAVALALVTLAMRKRVLRLYQSGVARRAVVEDTHRSPLVPGQKIARLSIEGTTSRGLTAAYPDRLPPLTDGESIACIVDDATDPGRAIIGRAYGLQA